MLPTTTTPKSGSILAQADAFSLLLHNVTITRIGSRLALQFPRQTLRQIGQILGDPDPFISRILTALNLSWHDLFRYLLGPKATTVLVDKILPVNNADLGIAFDYHTNPDTEALEFVDLAHYITSVQDDEPRYRQHLLEAAKFLLCIQRHTRSDTLPTRLTDYLPVT